MSLSGPFIRRPVATSLSAIGLLLLGLAGYLALPVSSMPVVDLPTIVIRAALPGAGPETMAAAVATPIERQLGVIAGLDELNSINTEGSTTIVAQFALGRDIDSIAHDVQAALNAVAADLPAAMPQPPLYIKANPNVFPILTLALSSDALPPDAVYDWADRLIVQHLTQVPGVAQVEISGADKSALRIQADPQALAARGLTLDDVRVALEQAVVTLPAGSLEGPDRSVVITVTGTVRDAASLRRQIIAWSGGAPIRLGDVATVGTAPGNLKVGSWFNGDRAVLVDIRKEPGANTLATVDRVRASLVQLRAWLPPAIAIHVVADRTRTLRSGIADLQATMVATIALVVVVVGLFLRHGAAPLIPALTIPVTLAGSFAAMYGLGFSLDNLSIMALVIAIGFIVDDTIVMVETVTRLIEQGLPPRQAALRGARQVAFTIVALTAALLAALIPILFMPDLLGRFFREFGLTLAVAITLSAGLSLTLTPSLCARLLKPADGRAPDRPGQGPIARATAAYGRSLDWALARPGLMLGGVGLSVVVVAVLFAAVPKGFLPRQDSGVIRAVTDAPADISFAAMSERQGAVSRILLADPAVAAVTSAVGVGLWNALKTGTLTITLTPLDQRKATAEAVAARLRPRLAALQGIETYLSPVDDFGTGGGSGKTRYQFSIEGADLARLERWTAIIRDRLAGLSVLTDVTAERDQNGLSAHLAIDRATAGRLGVSPRAIDETLYSAFGQRQVATLYGPFSQTRLVLEADPAHRSDPAALARLPVAAGDGRTVPLSVVTILETRPTPVQISHRNQMPSMTIGFNPAAGITLGSAMAAIEATVREAGLPGDLVLRFAGEAKAAARAIDAQLWMLIGAIVAVYLVLGMLYESYAHPLTILSTIPSSGIGALVALMLTGVEFSLVAMIGLILLIGMVMKNAIMMVDFALVAERQLGLEPRAAIALAARRRFRPITMTTLAAVCGALPLAIGLGTGSELRQPLGIAIVGGLLLAQLVTLYTTPVVYLAVDRLRGRGRPRWLAADQPAE